MLSSYKNADSWFLTFNDEIVKMSYVVPTGGDTTIFGSVLKNRKKFFIHPVSSKYFYVFESDGETGSILPFKLDQVRAKMVRLKSDSNFVFLPLLHTLSRKK